MGAQHNRQWDLVPLLSSATAKTEMLNIKEWRDGGVCPDARQLGLAIFNLASCKKDHHYLVRLGVAGRKA